jgi:diguanylate cyclase (GGDEF)-like protein/PAS domain S-box-containing protein
MSGACRFAELTERLLRRREDVTVGKWFTRRQRPGERPNAAAKEASRHDLFVEWFEHAPDPVLLIQAKFPHRIVEANEIACRLLGYERSELVKLSPRHIVSDDVTSRDLERILQQLLRQRKQTHLWTMRTKEGKLFPVEINCRLVGWDSGEPLIFTEARDMTEKLKIAKSLEESEHIFDSLFEFNPNGVGVFNLEGRFVRANHTMSRILGYDGAELSGLPLLSLVPEEQLMPAMGHIGRVTEGEPASFDTALLHKRGYRVDVHMTAVPIRNGGYVSGYIAICQDITERKRTEEQNRYLAYFDDRTGLPNRRLFHELLHDALAADRSAGKLTAVFIMDIDRFKLVNDSFGHDYGDMLLMQVAERFQRCVGERDLLARTEGDEFAVFFSDLTGYADLMQLVPKLEHALDTPFSLGEFQLHVTVSMGIAITTADGEDADTLMKYADIALSRAKESGNNTYQIFNADMKTVSLHKLTLENELRKALAGGQFLLYYQPQMDIETGTLVGMEALIRWRHPERGIVPPKDFVPFAEESGLIGPMGEWVLYEACRQNKAWQRQGYPRIPVSVNLSLRQFLQHNLKHRIGQVLEETGLEAKYLELEITESMTMDVEHATNLLLDLKRLGVQVSIDDFGTGYSSLYYLKKFPIDRLKIDRSFVSDIMTDPNDAAIVTTIIAMTRHLNLKVIAEGVETKEQLHFLHRNRCNEVQGNWFSPPVPAERMEELLRSQAQAAPAAEEAASKQQKNAPSGE